MKNIIAYYDTKPSPLDSVGNGSYLYRFNIEQFVTEDNEGEVHTQWKCEEVTVWEPLTRSSITEAVITSKWDDNYEQKLINEYNSAKLGVYGDPESEEAKEKITTYTLFLLTRNDLKEQIQKDCDDLNIQ